MQASLKFDKNNGHSRPVVLRMRSVSNKSCRENQNKHVIFSKSPPESPAFYGMMWKHAVDSYRPRMTIWRMRIACWVPKAANTHS